MTTPTMVFLARHAVPRSGGDDADPWLSDLGLGQAALLGDWLAEENPVAVYASHLQRAYQTATPLAQRLGVEVQRRTDLREWTSARATYVTPEDLAHTPQGLAFAEARFEDFVPDHDRKDLQARMVASLREIGLRHPGAKVAVVSHGGALNSLLGYAAGTSRAFFFNPGYAAVSRLQVWSDGRLVVCSINETAHLDPARLRAFLAGKTRVRA